MIIIVVVIFIFIFISEILFVYFSYIKKNVSVFVNLKIKRVKENYSEYEHM